MLGLAIVSRLNWINRHRDGFARQPRQSVREMLTGEMHYFQGRGYRLDVVEQPGNPSARIVKNSTLESKVRPGTDCAGRAAGAGPLVSQSGQGAISGLLARWEGVIGRQVAECRIKQMKTRWGTCNIRARRIWLNLELIKKTPRCLEYVFMHEMVHLLERRHNDRFHAFMDQFMPDWRLRRAELNQSALMKATSIE